MGNSLLEEDATPLRLLKKLKEDFPQINFIEFDPTEEFPQENNFILIDTIKEIKEIRILKDIKKIKSNLLYSLHDFDLGFALKLAKKMGKIKEVTIIGLPSQATYTELKKFIANLLSKNDLHS